jgi:hypothetical protein
LAANRRKEDSLSRIRTPPQEAPAWWFDHEFAIAEIVEFMKVPRKTLEDWLAKSREYGHYPGAKRGRYRLYAAHHIFALALLERLHRIGWPIDADTVNGAFTFAVDRNGTPRAPGTAENWDVVDEDGATVSVAAWLAYAAVRNKFDPTKPEIDGYTSGYIVPAA